jgi:hypothetical protein
MTEREIKEGQERMNLERRCRWASMQFERLIALVLGLALIALIIGLLKG